MNEGCLLVYLVYVLVLAQFNTFFASSLVQYSFSESVKSLHLLFRIRVWTFCCCVFWREIKRTYCWPSEKKVKLKAPICAAITATIRNWDHTRAHTPTKQLKKKKKKNPADKMTIDDCSNNSLLGDNRKGGAIRLQIVPAQPKTLSHLPTRPAVDLAFHDLVYSVREGRRNRKYNRNQPNKHGYFVPFHFIFAICFSLAHLVLLASARLQSTL